MIFYYFCIMKNLVRNIAIIVTLLLLCRCANVVTPSGGPKDAMPPVVLETTPENNSTNFKGRSIHITFDEFITLNNPSNKVLISPPLDKKPTYRTNGKTLIIRFEGALKPETTYSINFGDAIKDLHEGNVFSGYTFNFSTGEKIDSLSLKGKVKSASTLKPVDNIYVALYSLDNDTVTLDSIPYKLKPNYITTSDKEGVFEFNGLADKEYLLFALKDNNSNLIYDLPNEEIGFYSGSVKPYFIDYPIVKDTISKDSITAFDIFTFIQEDSVQKIFKKELVEDGLLRFVFRYPANNVDITALEELPDTFNITKVFSAKKDTVLWYFTPNKDSLLISINDGVNISDTTHYSLKPRESVSKRKKKQTTTLRHLGVKSNLKGNKLKPYQPLILTFNEPVLNVSQPDSILFVENKDTIYQSPHFERIDDYGFKYQIVNNLKPENKYQLVIHDSVFFGVRKVVNDSIKLSFSVQEESAFGNIYLSVDIPENVPQVIIELLDSSGKLVDKQIITGSQEISFEYLDPGKYTLKAILDIDANGEWSPGNFKKRLQPEKIVFYKGVLEVRANWDIDLEEPWKIEK